jgi:hypothetical protein
VEKERVCWRRVIDMRNIGFSYGEKTALGTLLASDVERIITDWTEGAVWIEHEGEGTACCVRMASDA